MAPFSVLLALWQKNLLLSSVNSIVIEIPDEDLEVIDQQPENKGTSPRNTANMSKSNKSRGTVWRKSEMDSQPNPVPSFVTELCSQDENNINKGIYLATPILYF